MRCLLASASCIFFLPLAAQEQRHYQAEFPGPLSSGQVKEIHAGLLRLDHGHELTAQGAVLDIHSSYDLDAARFQAVTAPIGLTAVRFTCLSPSLPSAPKASHSRPRPVDFPVRLDTGDPIADDARYEEQKSAWIATYPELYKMMTEPDPPRSEAE